jgi:hypothetical protein
MLNRISTHLTFAVTLFLFITLCNSGRGEALYLFSGNLNLKVSNPSTPRFPHLHANDLSSLVYSNEGAKPGTNFVKKMAPVTTNPILDIGIFNTPTGSDKLVIKIRPTVSVSALDYSAGIFTVRFPTSLSTSLSVLSSSHGYTGILAGTDSGFDYYTFSFVASGTNLVTWTAGQEVTIATLQHSGSCAGNGTFEIINDAYTASINGSFYQELDLLEAQNVIYQSSAVSRLDQTVPTITCPSNVTVSCTANIPVPFATATLFNAGGGSAMDNCTAVASLGLTSANGTNTGDINCNYSFDRTYTVTDGSTNTNTCMQTISVAPPVAIMTAPADITVACGAIPSGSTINYSNVSNGGCMTQPSNTSTFSATPPVCGGTVTETWTATDLCGRTVSSVSRTITVSPAALPTMTAPADITVACGAIPVASTIASSNGLSGGCELSGTSNSSTFSATPPACGGTVTETWTSANDACGRPIASVSRTITVSPAALPTMTAPADITVACGAIPATSTITYSNGLSGGCELSGTSNTSTFSTTPPACGGTVTETWTAVDACSRTIASVSRTITVSPAALPTMTAPADITVACGAIPATSTITYSNGLSGGCELSGTSNTSTFSTTPPACGGTVTETWTAMDACSRTIASVSRTITVSPAALPTMTAPLDITVACGAIPATSTITYSNGLSGGCELSGTSNTSTFSATPPACGGTVTETWTAMDACSRTIASVSRTITITPAALPIMTAPADITVACGAIPAASTITYTNGLSGGCELSGTSDNSTFTTTPGVCGGTVTETWTAMDGCSRTITSVSRTITVSPAALPTMIAPSNITVTCQDLVPMASTINFTNSLSGGCILSGTSASSTFTTIPNSCNQTITETWTATDGCSRALVPVTRTILVKDDVLPAITAPASITVSVNNAGCTATGVTLGTPTGISDNCSTPTVTNNGISTYPFGNTTVVWTATDGCGNTKTSEQVVTVETSLAATAVNLASTSLCTGESTNLSFTITGGLSPYTVVYSRTPGSSVSVSGYTSGQMISVNPTAPGGTVINYVYTVVSVTDAIGCVINPSALTNTLTINPLPTATNTVGVSCTGTPVNFDLQAYMNSGGNAVNSSYSWYVLTDNPFVTGEVFTPQTGNTINTVLSIATAFPQSVVYRVTPTSSPAGCLGSNFDITITIYPIPNAAATDKGICSGSNTALTVTNPNGVFGASFNWTANYGAVTGGAGNATGVSFGTNSINELLTNATTAPIGVVYTITPIGSGPPFCPGTPITVTVTVTPTVGVPVIGGPSEVCQDDPNTMFTATSTNNTGITYSVSPMAAGVINTSTGEMNWDMAFIGTATITAVSTGCNGSSETGTKMVIVNPLPTITITQPIPVCLNTDLTNVVITPSITGGTISYHATSMDATSNMNPLSGAAVTEASVNTFVRYTLPNGCFVTGTINVVTGVCVSVTAKTFLQGPYNSVAGTMNDNLRSNNLIPLSDPYRTATYSGTFVHVNNPSTQTTTAPVLAVTGSNAIVDWVFLQLRSKADSSIVMATRAALIQRDGDIVDMDGVSPVAFNTSNRDLYFLSVRQRNHFGVTTSARVDYSVAMPALTDFTLSSTGVFGVNARRTLAPGILGLTTGNASLTNLSSGKGLINYNGSNNDRIAILTKLGGNQLATLAGYHVEDVNMDGIVRLNGANNDRTIILSNLGGNQLGSIIEQLLP